MNFISLLLLNIFFSVFCFAGQSSVILKEGKEFYHLGRYLDILEDLSGKLTIEDVNRPEWATKFKKGHKRIYNFGSSKSSFWARINVQNIKKTERTWFISQNYSNQDHLSFYKKVEGIWKSTETGDLFPFNAREIKDNSFSFKIKPGKNSVYFFKIRGLTNRFNLTISSAKAFIENNEKDRMLSGLFLGLIIAMILYNFFIFISTKSLSYLFYVSFVIFYGIELFIIQGFSNRFLAPESIWISNGGQIFFGGLAGFFGTLFAISILSLRDAPNLKKIMQLLSLLWFLLILSSAFVTFPFGLKNLHRLLLITGPFCMFCTLYRIKMNYRPAKYVLLAFSFMILGQIISVLMIRGILSTNIFTEQAINIGSAFQLILFSMALADRFNLIQEETLVVEENALKIEKVTSDNLKRSSIQHEEDLKQLTFMHGKLKETNEQLEEKVKERTKELGSSLEQLKKSIDEKSAFYAKVSHELRTPLNGILGFSQILLNEIENKNELDLSKKKEFLQCIFSSGQSLFGLVNEIHDYSKLDINKLIIKNQPFSIRNMANNISTFFVNECEKKGLKFFFHFDENIPTTIISDELRLKQILYNLLGNAVKFTNKGDLKLSMDKGPSKENQFDLVIKIEDTGIGIKAENLEKIFNTFEQVDEILPKEGGSGLGLHITQRIVEKMGGVITVSSEYKKGTLFQVNLLDLGFEDEDTKGTKDISLKNYQFYGDTILLADDLEPNLALIEAYLEPFELKIEKVKNGIDLLKKAIEIKPSLIITDIKMPLLDGHKAAKKLSEIRETLNIPVIGISATQENKLDLIHFDSYLEKPVERNLIIEEICLYLKHKKTKVDDKKAPVFILEESLGEIEKKIILKMKIIFEKNLELQNITDLENSCMGLKKDIHDNKLKNLMPWFENFLIEIGNFQIDLVNENSKMALSEIYKILK